MAESNPDPIHIIHDSRYAIQDGWQIDDISLCSSGNIAVSGHRAYQSYVSIYSSIDDNSDSRDKPTLLYYKQFTDKLSWLPRYISFIKQNSTEIVTCWDDEVQVIDYNRDVVLRSRKVNDVTRCVSVSENQIFIGLWTSDIVKIYDNDLNRIKSIRLKGIRDDYPRDIAAADRLYVCTAVYDRAIVYSQYSGNILTEYTTGQDSSRAYSIAVNIQLQIVAVLWYREHVSVYSFSDNKCLVDFNVESGVTRIRISDRGRIVTGNEDSGEIKIYELAKFFTFQNMKITIGNLLSERDAEELVKYFKINDDIVQDSDSNCMVGSKKKSRLLTVLEKKGVLQDKTFHDLRRAFSHLGNYNTSMVMDHIDFYQKHAENSPTRDQQTTQGKKSAHQLKLNGFSDNPWSVIDMSLGPAEHQMIISGFSEASEKTSLDWIHDKDSDAAFPWFRTREFDMKSVKQSKRFVTYIDESQIVSCCHNIVEIINLDTNESKHDKPLQVNESASCVTMRNGNIYIGFEHSAHIRVLNFDLEEKMKIKLKDTEEMWPTDLAVTIGRLLVCLKKMSSCKVFLFSEVNGKKLIEYRNDVDKAGAPVSITIHEESDLAVILWDVESIEDEFEEEYYTGWNPEDRTYSYVSLHSLSQGFCLSVVSIGLSVHDFDHSDIYDPFQCYKGCSSGKKVRISSGCDVAVLDTLGGVNFFDMKDVLTSDNVKSALCQMIVSNASSYKCKRKCNNSDNHNDDDNGQNRPPRTEIGGGGDEQDEDSDTGSSSESGEDHSEEDKSRKECSNSDNQNDDDNGQNRPPRTEIGGGGDEQDEDCDTGSSSESEEDHSEKDKSKKECNNSDNQNDNDNEQNKHSRTDIGDAGDEQDEDCDTGSSSESEEDHSEEDEEIHLSPEGKHIVDIILTILTDKQLMKSDDVSVLKRNISHSINSYYARNVRQVKSKGDPVQCDRFQWDCDDYDDDDFDEDSGNCMDISFGSNNELAVVLQYMRQRTYTRCVHMYYWDKNNGMQSSLNFYRKFDDGRCKLFVSCLQGFQTVTCCDDLIEITDFNAHGRIIKSYRLSSASTCMATKDGDIFVGVKSSEIVVFDSELVQKRSVTVNFKKGEWPGDLTIVTGKFFVCTNGTSKRAMSLNLENGEQLTEYTYSRGTNYEMCPRNITASENLDLIGVSWFDGDDERVTVTALYSLSKGFCVSIVDYHSAGIIRFSPDNYMFIISMDGDIEYSNESQLISFDGWKTGFAHSFSLYECKMLIAFYNLSLTEIIDNVDWEYLENSYMMNIGKMKSILEILTKNSFISSTNVTELGNAFSGLGRLYEERLNHPLDAYIKYASETCGSEACVSVPFGASNNIAETLLQLQYPSESRNNNGNSVCLQGNFSQSYPVAQPPSLGLVFSSLMGRDGASITESVVQSVGKRPYSEGDHSATDSRIHGKRLKVTDVDSQTTRGTAMRSSISQALPGTATTALGACVLANQVISHEMPFSGEPSFLTLLQSPQPVTLDAIPPSNITQLNPSNERGQSRHLQASQQMIHLERPARTESIATFNISQTPHIGQHLRTPSSHEGLPQPRNTTIQVSPSNPSSDMQLSQRLTHSSYNRIQNREQTTNTHTLQQAKQFLGNQPRSDPSQSFRQQAEHFEQQNIEKLVTFLQVLQQPNNMNNNTFRENEGSNHELHNVNEELQTEPAIQQTDLSPSNDTQSDIPDGEIQAGLGTVECDSFETSIRKACEQMLATAKSPFQKHQAIVLKSIHGKLDCLAGSSKSCQWQETPGTQSHSFSKENALRNGNECEQVAINYLESLPEEDKNFLLAFKDMNDDREELVRRLVEKMYTGEERKNGNTSGTGNFKKLDEDKLQKIRFTVFHLCPIRSRKQFTDKLQDKEWKRLCEVIDTANRHYRQELKRQSKRKHTKANR